MRRRFVILLVLGILSEAVLIGLNEKAINSWQGSSNILAERRARETADLLFRALSRDMLGAEDAVLSSAEWDASMLAPPYDIRTIVASAFARYPYPESFFCFRETPGDNDTLVFFSRPDRSPSWIGAPASAVAFPVSVTENPAGAAQLLTRIHKDSRQQRAYSMFDIHMGDTSYQVVSRLVYTDPTRSHLLGVLGFMVNLAWIRQTYFRDLILQVAGISGTETAFYTAVRDANRTTIWERGSAPADTSLIKRMFPLTFFDPTLVELDPPADMSLNPWTIEIGFSEDAELKDAIHSANRMRFVAAAAGLLLAFGLVLTVRASQANARLVEMRSEFISSVTHELKTPIATIRAIGDTLRSGRISGETAISEYTELLVQESKRLERRVENLLAFARITDIADTYSFEPILIDDLVDDVLENFRTQLINSDFQLIRDISPDLPPILGDRTALELMLDNILDNAIRYSSKERVLTIEAHAGGPIVTLTIRDRGQGIPTDELGKVTRKFFRGRHTRTGGTGLGLAIVKRIVEDHHGVLSIASELGVGTGVTVKLPANDVKS